MIAGSVSGSGASNRVFLGKATAPEGVRLYAIGDVHGCDAALAEMHERIAADLAARPTGDHRIIHIGDYVDRGPDSAGVVRRLAGVSHENPRAVFLLGNHDERLLAFLDDPVATAEMYLDPNIGGAATLRSYGVALDRFGILPRGAAGLSSELRAKMPPEDRAFLDSLRLSARFGDYLFVHAGIRPGVAFEEQDPEDLIWIRQEFLRDERDHGCVVVHGHTPAKAPEVRPNRINIDTGAVFGGALTCLVLEGTEHRFL